jgi:hypothetical protein
LVPDQWRELVSELSDRPPTYLFISSNYARLIQRKSPQLASLVADEYHSIIHEDDGTWFAPN